MRKKSLFLLLFAISCCTTFMTMAADTTSTNLPQSAKATSGAKIYLCGGTSTFRDFLQNCVGPQRLIPCDTLADLSLSQADAHTLFVILPQYDLREMSVQPMTMEQVMQLAEAKRIGAKIYLENYPSRDYLTRDVFGFYLTGRPRYFNQETLVAGHTVLQATNLFYCPQARPNRPDIKVLAHRGDASLLHVAPDTAQDLGPVLTDDGAGCVSATANLTCFDPLFDRPRRDWKDLFVKIWGPLLDCSPEMVENAFDQTWPPVIALANQTDAEAALHAAVNWHLASGLLPAPDGSQGLYELLRSDDLQFRANLRTDSILMTGALLAAAGKACHKPDWLQTGKNLADFILNRNIQTEDGFTRWYDNLSRVYANDLARHGLALLYLWENTGEERYRISAQRLEKAAITWLAPNGVCCGNFDVSEGYDGQQPVPSPVFHGELAAFLLKSNSPEARDTVRKMLKHIDLNSQAIGHSKPDVWSRAFLMYACAHQTLQDCTAELETMLDYFENHQAPQGGLWEDDLFTHRSAPLEAGVAPNDRTAKIADLLYCNNFVFAALSVLRKKTDSPRVHQMYQRLRDFLLRVQIVSKDPRFNGAWLRAFDLDYAEYYGLTLDRDWGPYCSMAGWTMGTIPLVLLDDLYALPFFDSALPL